MLVSEDTHLKLFTSRVRGATNSEWGPTCPLSAGRVRGPLDVPASPVRCSQPVAGVQRAGNVVPDRRNGVKPPTEPGWREHCCALQSKLHGFQRQF